MSMIKVSGWFTETVDPKKPDKTGKNNKGIFEFPEGVIKYILHEATGPGDLDPKKRGFIATIFFHETEETYPLAFRLTSFHGRTF